MNTGINIYEELLNCLLFTDEMILFTKNKNDLEDITIWIKNLIKDKSN